MAGYGTDSDFEAWLASRGLMLPGITGKGPVVTFFNGVILTGYNGYSDGSISGLPAAGSKSPLSSNPIQGTTTRLVIPGSDNIAIVVSMGNTAEESPQRSVLFVNNQTYLANWDSAPQYGSGYYTVSVQGDPSLNLPTDSSGTYSLAHTFSLSALNGPDVLRQRGSDYIDALYGACFFGFPTGFPLQERAWPRTGVTVNGITISPDDIPRIVVEASYRAAYLISQNPAVFDRVVDPERRIKRQKVDNAVEREFFEGGSSSSGTGSSPYDTVIDGMLKSLVDQVCMGREDGGRGLFIQAVGS